MGPRWNDGNSDEDNKLKNCYINSLKLAEEHGIKTIAFPNISTGIYRFPKERAAKIALDTVSHFESSTTESVTFVCYDDENYQLYTKLIADLEIT